MRPWPLFVWPLYSSFFGKNFFRYLSLYFLAPVRMGVVRNLRQQSIHKILALPVSWFTESRKEMS